MRRYIGQAWKGNLESPQSRGAALKTILEVVAIYAAFLGLSSASVLSNRPYAPQAFTCLTRPVAPRSAVLHGTGRSPEGQRWGCTQAAGRVASVGTYRP